MTTKYSATLIALGLSVWGLTGTAQGEAGGEKLRTPAFRVDPFWPKLPGKWMLGMLTGVAVDRQDHVWILHRPGTVKDEEKGASLKPPQALCCEAAPPVIEFDAAGNYLQSWGGPGEGYEWPLDQDEHGIFVDYKDNVWICAGGGPNSRTESQILKFTKQGKFLVQIGHRGKGHGSNDTENLGQAADVFVYPKTNEVFVADGYGNRRVIVFDADTGAYKRHWGAYGNKPDDSAPRTAGANGENQQFSTVHHLRLSNDGLVYVADRRNDRVQVFTIEGKFLKEVFLARDTKVGTGTAFSIAFSGDSKQQFLYVVDLSNAVVHILSRPTLTELGTVGRMGRYAGEFIHPHNIAADSKGNLYVTEAGEGRRVQKLVFTGFSGR